MSWEPINWDALAEQAPVVPTTAGLIYPGRRHVFSGPPEACKTWAALALALDEIRAGGTVLHVDHEMFAIETRDRLRSLGATPDEFARFLHVEPEHPGSESIIGYLVEQWTPTLAIIDAAAGAYALQGLDDNHRQDVETFTTAIIEPFRTRGVATILLDHVTKNRETRGGFSIGSERKIGGADVHLGFEMTVPFGRGRCGLVKVSTHKDRFGHLPRPTTAELELRSDATTGAVTWKFRGIETDDEPWMPTTLMEKVSRHLAETGPQSRNEIEKAGLGRKAQFVRQALDALILQGHVIEQPGPRRARLCTVVRPFTSSDLVPLRPDEDASTSSTSSRPYKGRSDETKTKSEDDLSLRPAEELQW